MYHQSCITIDRYPVLRDNTQAALHECPRHWFAFLRAELAVFVESLPNVDNRTLLFSIPWSACPVREVTLVDRARGLWFNERTWRGINHPAELAPWKTRVLGELVFKDAGEARSDRVTDRTRTSWFDRSLEEQLHNVCIPVCGEN